MHRTRTHLITDTGSTVTPIETDTTPTRPQHNVNALLGDRRINRARIISPNPQRQTDRRHPPLIVRRVRTDHNRRRRHRQPRHRLRRQHGRINRHRTIHDRTR